MYFILSKLLLFLILPLNWVLTVLIISIFKRDNKKRRLYVIGGLILLYIFTIPLLFKGFTRIWDVEPGINHADSVKYSCVIVLGGFAGSDGKNGGRFTWAADRFIHGARLVSTGKAGHILITGGNSSLAPKEFREAPWAKLQLQQLGIADSLILIESGARNTIENAELSKEVLLANNLKPPYLLVTSAFHMRRSVMIFKKKGLDVVPYPCSYLANNAAVTWADLLPQANILSHWEFYLKEVTGYVVNRFFNK